MPPMARLRPPLWACLSGHRLLKGRAGHTATLVGKKLFVIGGRNGNEFFNDLWEFNIEKNQWKLLQKHTPVTARAYHTATLIQSNQIWVIGGSDKLTMYGDVHVLNTNSLEWTSPVTKGQLAGKLRGTHAAIQHPLQEKGILVYGGYGGIQSHWLRDLAILQTDTLVWEELHPTGVAPGGRGYHTLTAFGTHVLLFGGKGHSGIVSSDTTSVYDAEVNMWTAPTFRGVTPVSRSNHAATLITDNLVVIHGGRNGSERLRDICLLQILSPPAAGCVDSFAWQIVDQEKHKVQRKGKSSDPGGRSAHALVAEGSALYLFGGYGGDGVTFNDIFVIQLAALNSSVSGVPSKTAAKGSALGRRLRTEIDDTEGWRTTKQPRHNTHPRANNFHTHQVHILDSDDNATENTSNGVPGHVNHAMEDIERRRSSIALTNTRPQTAEAVQEARTEAFTTLPDVSFRNTTRENDRNEKKLASLQLVVDSLMAEVNSLKAAINSKNLLESELRAGKAALQQNIQLLQNQVEEGHQKTLVCTSEIERWKSEAQTVSAQLIDQEREKNEAVQKMASSNKKVEDLSRSLESMKVVYSNTSQELDSSKLEVQNHVRELQKRTLEMQQMRQMFEQQIAVLNKNDEERKDSTDGLSKELAATKDSSRALQETVERLSMHVERDNAKIDVLEKEKENLIIANTALAAEQVQLLEARYLAEATLELAKGEVRVARSVIERNAGEIARMKENAEQAKEHITSLYASLKKYDEELNSISDENEKLRLLIKEIEDFENAQVRSVQNHVEKLRCAREFGPRC